MIDSIKKSVARAAQAWSVRKRTHNPNVQFTSSPEYWDLRYKRNGSSGAGSYGRLAEFKAEVINDFVGARGVRSVIEFGCGDGNQLSLANYKDYIGVDVSATIIEKCNAKFRGDAAKRFILSDDYDGEKAELALSLDVIYHLVEDDVFEGYMASLFNSAERYVIVYSSNCDRNKHKSAHVRHRRFTAFVEANLPQFELIEAMPNRYPYSIFNRRNTSFADFFIFERK